MATAALTEALPVALSLVSNLGPGVVEKIRGMRTQMKRQRRGGKVSAAAFNARVKSQLRGIDAKTILMKGTGRKPPRTQTLPNAIGQVNAYSSSKKNKQRVFNGSEYVGEISGTNSSTPTVTSYYLNPGLAATFPRLSSECKVWEQYRFTSLTARYAPAVGSSMAGKVVLSPDYDPNDAPPTTLRELMDMADSATGAPWTPFGTALDPATMNALGPRKNIRVFAVPASLTDFDSGILHVATCDNGGTTVLGSLWLDYSITMFVPKTEDDTPSSTTLSMWSQGSDQALTTTVAATLDADSEVTNPLHITCSNGSFTPPAGAYEVHANVSLETSAAQPTSILLQLFKNGAATTTPQSIEQSSTSIASKSISVNLDALAVANGTDVFIIRVTATFGGGTCTAKRDFSRVCWKVV